VADSLTKAVPRQKLEYCRKKMGVLEVVPKMQHAPCKITASTAVLEEEVEDFC
jgi:hypothetical protein